MNGLWLIKIRKKLELSQEEFADLLGVHKNTISNWENSDRLSLKTLGIVEDYLKSSGNISIMGDNNSNIGNNILNESIGKYGNVTSSFEKIFQRAEGIGEKLNLEKEIHYLKLEIDRLKQKNEGLDKENKSLNDELLKCKDRVIDLLSKK